MTPGTPDTRLNVGKGEHHAVGLNPNGTRPHDAPLPNSASVRLFPYETDR